MTKKSKKFIYITLGTLIVIVFLVFYFKDNADTDKIEKVQEENAAITADTLEDLLNSSFDEVEFENDSL